MNGTTKLMLSMVLTWAMALMLAGCSCGGSDDDDDDDDDTVPAECGNGTVEEDEVCDSGEDNGTYGECNEDCTAVIECGDGIVSGPEECDDGNTASGDGCGSGCAEERCGDGVVQGDEVCDDGANNGTYNMCAEDCAGDLVCGDGVFTEPEEECEDGNIDDNDGCNSDCEEEYCGDGVVNGSEQCDGGDACNADCTRVPTCGDGFVDGEEECDDGNESNTDSCVAGCVEATCGDGFVEAGVEDCDGGAGCAADCTLIETCGDGVLDDGEACDNGVDNGSGYGEDSCNNGCTGPNGVCGDGVVNGPEVCDDGNDVPDDTCNNVCQLTAGGDTLVLSARIEGANVVLTWSGGPNASSYQLVRRPNNPFGSEAILQNTSEMSYSDPVASECLGYTYVVYPEGNTAAASNSISVKPCVEGCGNGILEEGEGCDAGEANGTADGRCTETCEAVGANCGNGSVEAAEGEDCDGAAGSFPANAMCGGDCRFDCVYGYELQEGACTEIVIITPF